MIFTLARILFALNYCFSEGKKGSNQLENGVGNNSVMVDVIVLSSTYQCKTKNVQLVNIGHLEPFQKQPFDFCFSEVIEILFL